MDKLEVDVTYIIVGARIAGVEPGDELIIHNGVVIGFRRRGERTARLALPAPEPTPEPTAAARPLQDVSPPPPPPPQSSQMNGTKSRLPPPPPPLRRNVTEEAKTWVWEVLGANPGGLTMRALANIYQLEGSDVLGRNRLRSVIDTLLKQKLVDMNPEDKVKEARYPRFQAL
jgi:hypothetical protein